MLKLIHDFALVAAVHQFIVGVQAVHSAFPPTTIDSTNKQTTINYTKEYRIMKPDARQIQACFADKKSASML